MSNTSRSVKDLSPRAQQTVPRAAVFVALLLALGLGSTRPVTAAEAQQGTSFTKRYYLNFSAPGLLCVGQVYPLNVTPLVELDGTWANGGKLSLKDRVVPGILIEAEVQDTNIASISPKKDRSGVLPSANDLLGTTTLGAAKALGEVHFQLQAKKPGATNLYLKATIPKQLVDAQSNVATSAVTFRVVNCRYKVTMASTWSFQAPNLKSTLLANTVGEMVLSDLSGESNALSGTANVHWNLSSISARCVHKHDEPKAAAKLSGTLNMDESLAVQVDYDPFEMSTSNCASESEGQFAVPPLQVNVPANGATRSVPVAFTLGKMAMKGTAVITVTPIQSK